MLKDLVTSGFDVFFIVFAWSDIKYLYRDKRISGVDYRSRFLYVIWGIWSTLVIYNDAGLVLAKYLNVIWTLEAAIWLSMALWFKRQEQLVDVSHIDTLAE